MIDKNVAKEIIENIAVFDETVKIFEEISDEISSKIAAYVADYLQEYNEWSGNFEIEEFFNLQFSNSNWSRINEDEFNFNNYFARFYVSYESKYSEIDWDHYSLTNLMHSKTNERAVFEFFPRYDNYKKLNKTLWKKFIQQQFEESSKLEALGLKFYPIEGSWYLPIASIDPKYFAECYVNDNTEDAFTPIKEALDILMQATPIFDKIIEKAKAEFGVAED